MDDLTGSGTGGDVTKLLDDMRSGDAAAAEKLVPLVYQELRRLAAAYLSRERSDHTLQATALVNEAYLKLATRQENFENRAHFFGVAANIMRHILVDYARSRNTNKRGGDQQKLPLDEALVFSEQQSAQVVALDEALDRLAKLNERQAKIVELRFFAGLSIAEIAQALGVGARTVNRDWTVAQAWLRREMSE